VVLSVLLFLEVLVVEAAVSLPLLLVVWVAWVVMIVVVSELLVLVHLVA